MLECTKKWYNYTPQVVIEPKKKQVKKRDRTGVIPIDRRGMFKRVKHLPPNGVLAEEKSVCKILKLPIEAVMGASRYDELVSARHIIWHFLYKHPWATQEKIGKRYGVSHCSVANGLQKVDRMQTYGWYRDQLQAIRELINKQ